MTHRVADIRVAWLVYVRTNWVLIATTLFGRRPNNKTRNNRLATGRRIRGKSFVYSYSTKFYALDLGKLSYISIHDHVVYTEFLLLHVFFIFFRDLNFRCGLYGYKISRECLFAESLISNILFFTIAQNAKEPHN